MHTDTKDNHHEYTYEELAQYFHMPINDVSQELGICATLLKKICRKNGINRWPHRKIKSLDKMIEAFELLSKTEPDDYESISNDIQELKEKRDFLLKNPNVSYNSVLPKHCVNAYNARIQKTGHLIESSKRKENLLQQDNKPTKTIQKTFARYPRRSLRNVDKPTYQEDGLDSSGDEEMYISPFEEEKHKTVEKTCPDEMEEGKENTSPSSSKKIEITNHEVPSEPPLEEESAACLLLQLHSDIWHSKAFQNSHLPTKLRWKQHNSRVQEYPSKILKHISDFINSPLTV